MVKKVATLSNINVNVNMNINVKINVNMNIGESDMVETPVHDGYQW